MTLGFLISGLCLSLNAQNVWRDNQLKNERVKQAYRNHYWNIDSMLRECHINPLCYDIHLQVYKEQEMVAVYLKNKDVDTFSLFNVYDFCSNVGFLGPKLRQGDFQIPEGFYEIESFNPQSAYHLGLRVNYPNPADKRRNNSSNLGGDIMVHGGCATIGCIPIGDSLIEQLYILATEAKNCGQEKITLYIFPNDMNASNHKRILEQYPASQLHSFWRNLLPLYKFFEKTKILPEIGIDPEGQYYLVK